ncbi:MAG: ABC transporter ATP-binding protein [Acidimicrobiales bacterium]|nr:ABC transporter ATP-binding protein [Acidimicrobiales bacterium]
MLHVVGEELLTVGNAEPTCAIEVRDLQKAFGEQPVLRGVDLRVSEGAIIALLGPSGCGKTTLLRTIAGLEQADAGTIVVGGRRVSGGGAPVAPEHRRIGMVFQDWALFPHLDVAANVGYGLPRRERTGRRIEEALELVGLAGLGKRRPCTLSGGQQQRVALARAIAPQPAVLLLDEPFSNLDTTLRVQVRTELHQLLADLSVTTVFVTHDQEEAFVLGDEVAVMTAGQIVQQAPPADLYDHPVSPWVADFVGDANLVTGMAAGGRASTVVGDIPLRRAEAGAVRVLLRPEELRLSGGGDAVVELTEYYGHDTVYVVQLPTGPVVRVRSGSTPHHRRGDAVTVTYAGAAAVSYPAATA